MAKSTRYIVVHPKLNMAVGGKSQRVEAGTILPPLTDAQIESLGSKIKEYVEPPVMSAIVALPSKA